MPPTGQAGAAVGPGRCGRAAPSPLLRAVSGHGALRGGHGDGAAKGGRPAETPPPAPGVLGCCGWGEKGVPARCLGPSPAYAGASERCEPGVWGKAGLYVMPSVGSERVSLLLPVFQSLGNVSLSQRSFSGRSVRVSKKKKTPNHRIFKKMGSLSPFPKLNNISDSSLTFY